MGGMFGREYMDSELGKIGSRIKRPLAIYLIGGCAMSLKGLKEATKDIDIVFRSRRDCEAFCDALFGAEYFKPYPIKDEYGKLGADGMYENKDGFHLDLFIRRVVKKLFLSGNMVERSALYRQYGNLAVYLLSNEDIFLFKALASEGRARDLPDMLMLYPDINWRAMEEEVGSQKLSGELRELLKSRLNTFSRQYRLEVPLLERERKSMEGKNTDSILRNSTLTEEDAEEIGHGVKKEIRKRFSREK